LVAGRAVGVGGCVGGSGGRILRSRVAATAAAAAAAAAAADAAAAAAAVELLGVAQGLWSLALDCGWVFKDNLDQL